MKGFKYLSNSTSLIDCTNIEDEICNGGPPVWTKIWETCEWVKPCKIVSYKGSIIEYSYHNSTSDEAHFVFGLGRIRTIGKELLVYDTNDMIGSIGGSLGLYLGFSFYGVASTLIDKLLEIWIKVKQRKCIQVK